VEKSGIVAELLQYIHETASPNSTRSYHSESHNLHYRHYSGTDNRNQHQTRTLDLSPFRHEHGEFCAAA
jgi:hypothetical protein